LKEVYCSHNTELSGRR